MRVECVLECLSMSEGIKCFIRLLKVYGVYLRGNNHFVVLGLESG